MLSLELQSITKKYRSNRVLDGIDHVFTPGLTLLTGLSGAGKSTLLRIIATAEKPTSELSERQVCLMRSGCSAVTGYPPHHHLRIQCASSPCVRRSGLELATADRQLRPTSTIDTNINNRISTFSGGMRRRLIFAQAMLGNPRLLALDEPTAELDQETARRVGEAILERAGSAIEIMTTHLADELAPHATDELRVERGSVTNPAALAA
jgi:ABC-type multidrug transport system ATPase subunit